MCLTAWGSVIGPISGGFFGYDPVPRAMPRAWAQGSTANGSGGRPENESESESAASGSPIGFGGAPGDEGGPEATRAQIRGKRTKNLNFENPPPHPGVVVGVVGGWGAARPPREGPGRRKPKYPLEIGPITLPRALKHTVRKEIKFPSGSRVLRPRGTPKRPNPGKTFESPPSPSTHAG